MRVILVGAMAFGVAGCASARPAVVDEPAHVHATTNESAGLARLRQGVVAADEHRWEASAAVGAAQELLTGAAEQQQRAEATLAAAPAGATAEAAQRRLAAARAKREYGRWLVAERRARFDEADAQAQLAAIELETAQADVLQRTRQAVGVPVNAILEEREQASRELAEARQRTQRSATELAAARDAWEQLQRRSDAK